MLVIEYSVQLTDYPADRKVTVLRAMQKATGLSLKGAIDLLREPPCTIAAGVSLESADRIASALYGIGASVHLHPCGTSEVERLMRMLEDLTVFCEENNPGTFAQGRDPEVVHEIVNAWDTVNTLAEVFLARLRSAHNMPAEAHA
jgi:hypothetical protein